MAELIHDLTRDVSLDDLSTILPYSAAELADFESLLQLPDGLDAFIEEQVEREAKDAPKVLSFVLDADVEAVERAGPKSKSTPQPPPPPPPPPPSPPPPSEGEAAAAAAKNRVAFLSSTRERREGCAVP